MPKISIYNADDRRVVAGILAHNGYSVRMGSAPIQGKKSYDYFVEYWKGETPDGAQKVEERGKFLDTTAIAEIQQVYVKGSPTYGVKPLSRRYGVSESAIEHALKVKLPMGGGDDHES